MKNLKLLLIHRSLAIYQYMRYIDICYDAIDLCRDEIVFISVFLMY
jgi:hypothetical protein